MNELILVRGLPGSGKSTFAKSLGGVHIETDMFFIQDGEYKFDGAKIKEAHEWCQNEVNTMMILNHTTGANKRIVVSNTFTQEWEMQAYYDLAKSYDYQITSIIVENRHGGENIHGVPVEAMDRMEKRFEIKLR